MKRITNLAFAIAIAISSQAALVKGRIYNPTFKEGEPFATIRIFKGNAVKPENTVVADADGEFSVNLTATGKYRLEVSALGKEIETRDFTIGNSDIDFGDIPMKDDVKNLKELVVTASRPLVQMTTDEMVYNVEADSDSKTYTLLEMLRKVPMVTVDGEDNITVNGSSNFQVYVDGKPSLLFSGNPSQIFKVMPASSVQNIEVVTNPGAKYDAEGVGGVINLVMNKEMAQGMADAKAYNVSLNLRGGNRGIGGNIYANAQLGKFTASLNLIENYSILGESRMFTTREEGDIVTRQDARSKPKLPFTMGSLNLNYDIDSLTSIGGSVGLNRFSNNYHGTIGTDITQGGSYLFKYMENSRNKGKREGINGSVNLSRDFGSKREHQLNLTYQVSQETNNSTYDNEFDVELPQGFLMDPRNSDSKTRTLEQVALADFSSKFDDHNKLSVGLKGTFRDAKADNTYMMDGVLIDEESINYKNKNYIGAAYAEYAFNNSSWNFKAGLRYEQTWQSISYNNENMGDYKNSYGNLVPSGSVGFNLRSNSNLGVNYNMRISRPGITYLNPFVNQSDPTQISYGNPDLEIEKTQNVSLVYNLFTPKITLNATLSNAYTGNGIEQFSFVENGVMNTTYGNIVKRNNTTLSAFMNLRLGTKTGITFNGSLSYLDIRSKELDAHNKGVQGSMMVGLQQQLPWEIRGSAFFIMSSKSRTLQGWNSGFKMVAVNFSKSFLKDMLGVSLGFNTGLSKGGNLKIENYVSTPSFSNKTTIKVPMLSVNVGVTIKFGNSARIKNIRENKIDNDFIDTKSQMESISNSEPSVM